MLQIHSKFVAICFQRKSPNKLSNIVGPCDEGGFKSYCRFMQHVFAKDQARRTTGDECTDDESKTELREVLLPACTEWSIQTSDKLNDLCEELILPKEPEKKANRIPQNEEIDVLLILQTQPSDEGFRNSANISEKLQSFIERHRVKLLALAVGESYEIADICSDRTGCQVLGWMNILATVRQTDVAFKFCYQVVQRFLSSLEQEQRNSATRAFLGTVDDFSRLMLGGFHTYTFGMNRDGEPCLFPDYPARPYVEWTIEMYETRLSNAANQCAIEFNKLCSRCKPSEKKPKRIRQGTLSSKDSTTSKFKEIDLERVIYRIATYMGWSVLIRNHPTHNKLSRGKTFYQVEEAFSENLTAEEANHKLCGKLYSELNSAHVSQLERFLKNQAVPEDCFQFFKVEMIAMGQAMLTRTRSCVVSRSSFFQSLNSNCSSVDAQQRNPIKTHYGKLCRELQEVRAVLTDENDEANATRRRELQQRFAWIHNAFRLMVHTMQYPTTSFTSFANQADVDSASSLSDDTSMRLDDFMGNEEKSDESASGGTGKTQVESEALSSRVLYKMKSVFPYVIIAGLLLERHWMLTSPNLK